MKHNLIAISGCIGSGKDEAYKMICEITGINYENKKFANKLKEITSILLGCTVEQLEDRDFKEKDLGDEWACWLEHYDQGVFLLHAKSPKERSVTDYLGGDYHEHRRMTPRLMLQLIGTEGGRELLHPNLWVNSLFVDYKEYCSKWDSEGLDRETKFPDWIITDCRFPNEADAVRQRGGIVIRLNRFTEEQSQHSSETALDNYKNFDYVIDNNGTLDDLRNELKKIVADA